MKLIRQAKTLAKAAHAGQTDKSGLPYFDHVERVAIAGETPDTVIVGYLHDILEDTPLTAQDLLDAGFPKRTVDAVVVLTRGRKEEYTDYIDRVLAGGELTIQVKIADIRDHLSRPSPLGQASVEKYQKALKQLTGV